MDVSASRGSEYSITAAFQEAVRNPGKCLNGILGSATFSSHPMLLNQSYESYRIRLHSSDWSTPETDASIFLSRAPRLRYLFCHVQRPWLVVIIPDIRCQIDLAPILLIHLQLRPSVTKESPRVLIIDVLHIVVFEPWRPQRLQMMQQTSGPEVHAAIDFILLVPGATVFGPLDYFGVSILCSTKADMRNERA